MVLPNLPMFRISSYVMSVLIVISQCMLSSLSIVYWEIALNINVGVCVCKFKSGA